MPLVHVACTGTLAFPAPSHDRERRRTLATGIARSRGQQRRVWLSEPGKREAVPVGAIILAR
jgi:hypothetical protein